MLIPIPKINRVLRLLCRFTVPQSSRISEYAASFGRLTSRLHTTPLIFGKGIQQWARKSMIWLFRQLLKGQTHHGFSHGVSLTLAAHGHTAQTRPTVRVQQVPAPTMATWSLPPAPKPATHTVGWSDCLHRVFTPLLEFQRASYALAMGFQVSVPDWVPSAFQPQTHLLSAHPTTQSHALSLALATVAPNPPPVQLASPTHRSVAYALPVQNAQNGQAAMWAQPICLKPVMADMLSKAERRHLEGFFEGPVRLVKLFAPLWTGLYTRLKLGTQGELLAWPGPDAPTDATPDCLILATCQRTGTWQRVVIKESERDRG